VPSRAETGVDRRALFVRALLVAILSFAFSASAQEQEPPPGEEAAPAAEAAAPEPGSGAEPEVASSDAGAPEADADAAAEPESSGELDEVEGEEGDEAEDPSSADAVEEFLVTASKIEILVPDSTISVVGFDPDRLKAEGISDIRDLSRFTPSLEIKSAFAASNPTIFIRGVGLDDYNANAASAVSIYQDGVYMQSPAGQLFQFFDVERVEVLRGPQPTLFRNAEAGAILVESVEPSDELDAYVTGTYGNYDLWEVEGAVGGPLVPELLAARASGSWEIRDGITKNRCAAPLNGDRSSDPSCNLDAAAADGTIAFQDGMEDWTNNLDSYALRGQLLFTPSVGETELEFLANVHGGKNRSRALQYQHRGVQVNRLTEVVTFGRGDSKNYSDNDGDPFAGDYNSDGHEDIDLLGYNLNGRWLFGEGYELWSLTAYEWHERNTTENSDASPKLSLFSDYGDKAWQVSQDLALKGQWASLFASEIFDGEWTLGAYYLQDTLDVDNLYDTLQGVSQHLSQEYTQKTRNYAAYLYTVNRLTPGCAPIPCDFTLTGGIRYNREHKDFDTVVCETGFVLCDTQTLEGKADDTWTAPSGEVSLAWNFTEDSSLYVKYSRGWKGGHFNGGATSVFDIITGVDPETVDSYEGGLRSFWFDQRLMLNTTFFYYDYRDLQVFIIDQTDLGYPIPKLVNAADSLVYGIELDVGAQPLTGLSINYNFAWVKSEYEKFLVTFIERFRLPRPCRTCPLPDPRFLDIERTYDYTGNPLLAAPRYSMTGSVEYELPIPTLFGRSLGTVTPRFSFSWKDQIYFDTCSGRGTKCNFPEGYFGEKPYWLFNAALTWRSEDDRFEVMGWIHNFMDHHYKTQNFDLSEGIGVILDAYAEPRTYGITATIAF
jgi:iron complex outermembrane receptor protein